MYHTFHDEVDNYRQHWWLCDGPCQKRPPYFGHVKRAMNRAPSPRDPWWADHQRTCGGTYRKIKEPEGYGQKTKKGGKEDRKGTGRYWQGLQGLYSRTCLEKTPHWPQGCGLSRQVISGVWFSYIEMKVVLPKMYSLSRQVVCYGSCLLRQVSLYTLLNSKTYLERPLH